jgi:hypothetical protein
MRRIIPNALWRIVRNPLMILIGFMAVVSVLLRLGPAIDGIIALLLWAAMIMLSVVVLVRMFRSGFAESAVYGQGALLKGRWRLWVLDEPDPEEGQTTPGKGRM